MSERIPTSHEQEVPSKELESAQNEQQEKIRDQLERRAERSPDENAESAKHEAFEHAKSAEKEKTKENETAVEKHRARPHKRTKKMLDQSFKKQMKEAQDDMSAPARSFSKFIHSKPVEAASEAIGSTVARPNAILAGSLSAFVLVTAIYAIAKHIGYPLSGFETIGAFIIGWLIGIMIDFFRIMITGKR